MQPNILEQLPDGLLEKPASALHQQLPGPTLIHIRGRNPQPLFVSVLQHGNEDTGWEAIRSLLKHNYAQRELPRSLCLFISNVHAARLKVRRLDDQLDFNRCWQTPNSNQPTSDHNPLYELFQLYTDHVRKLNPLAAIDIHNNTGLNPHYAAINRVDWRFIRLARLFSEQIIYFTKPHGTLANAMADFCPALTLECGQAGNIHGTDHAREYIEECMLLESIPNAPLTPEQAQLYHMLATVYVSPELEFSFMPTESPLSFISNLDHLNFKHLPSGTLLAHMHQHNSRCLLALNQHGEDVTDGCFTFNEGTVRTARPLMASMLTPDTKVIRQDCLCYLMERVDHSVLANA